SRWRLILLLSIGRLGFIVFTVWCCHDVWISWQCYEPIQIGRPVAEAKGILEQHGFTKSPVEGNGLSDQYALLYKRGPTDPEIWIYVGKRDGLVRGKSYNPGLLRWYHHVRINYIPDLPHI